MKFKTFIVFLIFIISLFLSYFVHRNEIEIPMLGHINADIRLNLEAPKNNLRHIKILADKNEITPFLEHYSNAYVLYKTENLPVKKLYIKVDDKNPEKIIKNIDNIALFVAHKFYYFKGSDVLKFEKLKDGIYVFPDNIKYSKNAKFLTDRGKMRSFALGFLSIFYNFWFYLVPFCFLFLGIFMCKTVSFKVPLKMIILIAIILRVADSNFPFWTDELYIATYTGNPDFSFITTFFDPGNPPLFNILARLWQLIVPKGEAIYRILPCIFSILTIFAAYYFVKENSSKKTALISSFLFAINLWFIYSAGEYRCYSLCTMLSVTLALLFFKIYYTNKNKYFILYALVAALSINTHYFETIVLLGNFIFAMIIFNNKSRLKFFFANLFAAVSFLPYFFITCLNKAMLDSSFNVMEKIPLDELLFWFNSFHTSAVLSVIVVAFCVIILNKNFKEKIFNNDDKSFRIYLFSVFSVIFMFIFVYLVSFIRPILRPYYFIICLPFIIISISLLITFPYKNRFLAKYFVSFILVCYFCLGFLSYCGRDSQRYVFEYLIKWTYFDKTKFLPEKATFLTYDIPEYRLFYKDYVEDYAKAPVYKLNYGGIEFLNALGAIENKIIYSNIHNKSFLPAIRSIVSKYGKLDYITGECDIIIARIIKR